ncbi:Protein FD [Apostasia shenzhenica]|uniref:Protein FD n=1 Tax=Apostasia shenzhenica TaxID=1088818 RepID=A0A2I0AEQ7_9ASPA|nr:Protein FD [Apostasia shenzhenica]
MWSSDARVVATSSSSGSRSSASSSSVVPQTPCRKTMEEIWKDINLATLHDSRPVTPSLSLDPHHHHKPAGGPGHRHSFRSIILQDFLAGAFMDPPTAAAAAACSGELPQFPLPPTVLSLGNTRLFPHPHSISSNSDNCPPAANTPGCLISDAIVGSKKRLLETHPCTNGGDRRHKRMMKNRESAARSRARKQAYTNELELEVAHLAEENSKLKKQNEELRMAMAAQAPKRKALQRTSSASF